MTDLRKEKYVVLGGRNIVRGPFDSHEEAAQWARRSWPERREGDHPLNWTVAVLQSPDEPLGNG